MKKSYTKPIVGFEDFTLSANIATGCGSKTGLPSKDQCGLNQGDAILFLTSITACNEKIEDDGTVSFCYHNPSDEQRLFSS